MWCASRSHYFQADFSRTRRRGSWTARQEATRQLISQASPTVYRRTTGRHPYCRPALQSLAPSAPIRQLISTAITFAHLSISAAPNITASLETTRRLIAAHGRRVRLERFRPASGFSETKFADECKTVIASAAAYLSARCCGSHARRFYRWRFRVAFLDKPISAMTRAHDSEDRSDHKSWAARYRRSAVEARHRAVTVKSEKAREALLKLAIEYDELAAAIEQKLPRKASK